MYKLIGIVMAVNTSLTGNQLGFRYPTVVRKEVYTYIYIYNLYKGNNFRYIKIY